MRTFDLSPLYRSSIGFDRMASLLDSAFSAEQNQPSYPPYNIELIDDDEYRITMAIAGFQPDELSVVVEQNTLKISGTKNAADKSGKFLHQGIAARNFERRFQLADHVKVSAANNENGLLHIELKREIPEAMRPRTIEINAGSGSSLFGENKAA